MAEDVAGLSFAPGFITLTDTGGRRTRYAVADILRALDIPAGLTYEQIGAITALANLNVVLVRTLIARGVLDEQFMDEGDYDLATIVQTIEDMGGNFVEPDLTVT